MTGISQLPRCYGNLATMATKSETLITDLSSAVLSQYLVWRFFGTRFFGISQLLHCYGNLVAMATRQKP